MTERPTAIEEQLVSLIDPKLVDGWGDPNKHPETQLRPDELNQLLQAGRELFIAHLTKDGSPIVTILFYAFVDGELWSTTVKGRVKEKAFRREPRCSLCLSSAGLDLPFSGGISIKAHAEIVDDRDVVDKVCRAHAERYYESEPAQDLFHKVLFTPNRVAMRFKFLKVMSWANIGVRRE